MKIWCCLGCIFGEDKEEVASRSDTVDKDGDIMKEDGVLQNDGSPEGNFGNNNEEEQEEEEEEVVAATRLGLALNNSNNNINSNSNRRTEGDDQDRGNRLRLFEEMIEAMRTGGAGNENWESMVAEVDVLQFVPRPAFRMPAFNGFRRLQGEGSTSGGGASTSVLASDEMGGEDGDRDSHNKRPRVYFGDGDWAHETIMVADASNPSSSAADRDFTFSQSTSTPSRNEIHYHNFMWNNSSDDSPFDCSGGRDDRDESDTSKLEDFEVRMDLTDDLLHMVFSFLNHINLCRAAMVCRQWRVASAHEDFWRCLNFENQNVSVEQFEDMCHRYPNATEVNIYGAPSIHLLVMKAVTLLRNLETLTLGRGQLGEVFFHALGDCNMLKNLTVNDATLGNGIQEIPINHDRLRHLKLTKCRVMRISIRCPQLETLSLKRSNMAQAVLNCPLLHLLDVGSCHKLADAAIRSAAISCPLLESLDMSNCSCVSDETLHEIGQRCANLHILNASYCPNISLESVQLPLLTVLKLHSCEGITSASMAALVHSTILEVLELDNCTLLTSVSLDLPRLQNIRLVHCRKFADLNLRSAMLSSIMVSNCPSLHRINITSNSLEKLALQKQENLTMLTLQCQCLLEVDLTDCESLTNSICEVFSDGGGCPMLKSLILDNCESLTAVRFCSTSLVSLSLVGCRAITALELACPRLEQVCLDGCDHLERASFIPVALQSLNLGICPKLNFLNIEAPRMVSLELKGCGVLAEASINCPLLTSLDASFCRLCYLHYFSGCPFPGPITDIHVLYTHSQLRDDCLSATTASCPLIESLILMSCPSVGCEGLLSLSWLPHLTILDLSYTFLMNLQPVFKSCLKLKVLKLQACKYLTDASLEPLYKEGALPALQELDLSYGTLRQSAIEELLAFCTHLTHLSLNGCVNMHDLNWGFSGSQFPKLPSTYGPSALLPYENTHDSTEQPNRLLQNLNCVGCANIRKVFIPPAARCSHLSSLNLSLSANLKEVDVSCSNLCFLNLSNCSSLEVLKLDCPKLTSLFLQTCNINEEAVEAAVSKCDMLETLDVRFCPKICSISMVRLRAACPSLKRIFSSLSPS